MTQEVSEKHNVELNFHGAISCCDGFSMSLCRGLLGTEWVSKCCFEGAMGEEGMKRDGTTGTTAPTMRAALPHMCEFSSQELILENGE